MERLSIVEKQTRGDGPARFQHLHTIRWIAIVTVRPCDTMG